MGFYASIISSIIGTGVKLLGSSGGPSYPSPPKLNKINIDKAQKTIETNEAQRMGASIAAWKQRFPLLFKGGQYEIGDIRRQQEGYLPENINNAIRSSGLEMPDQGDQYKLSRDIGLNPITLSQRTSEAVTKQIAMNPEWTSKMSGGLLATLIANNYQNQNAFSQFLGANRTAQYVSGLANNANTTATLLRGATGAASIGLNPYAPWNHGTIESSLAPAPAPITSSGSYSGYPNYYTSETSYLGQGSGSSSKNPYGNTSVGPVEEYSSIPFNMYANQPPVLFSPVATPGSESDPFSTINLYNPVYPPTY